MPVATETLEENYLFFVRELSRIDRELADLPKGSLSAKKIGGGEYLYHQWREGRTVRSVSVGRKAPPDLIRAINRRKTLEAQKKEILADLKVFSKAIDPQAVTVHEILRLFSQHKIHALLIGSYCLPAYKDAFKMKLPTIRTQDVDFLVPQPYKGKRADLESILADLGFSLGFNSDGSNYFTNGVFQIDFLTPEKGKGSDKAVPIKELGVQAEPLRYLQMLLDDPIEVKSKDLKFGVPNPWTFAFHKILIRSSRKATPKKDKDLLQAVSLLREILTRPRELERSRKTLKALPTPWKKRIQQALKEVLPEFLE